MQWDFNEGRWTTILEGGLVAHAEKVEEGWLVLIPGRAMRQLVHNKRLKTWLSAQAIVERVIEVHPSTSRGTQTLLALVVQESA